MNDTELALGTVETSEELIRELYIDLRRKVNKWSAITHQTAQARMGYVGQHLTSVATGYVGSRSGARGEDLVLPGDLYAEIKTCYRVDQLGECNNCSARVGGIEPVCPACGKSDILRKDDSKWLISIRHDQEFEAILDPKSYYLVLFEFTDLNEPDTILASISQIDPRAPGFALCMIDYYMNIRAASQSKAPFNLWPYQFKFFLMKPQLIYRSFIDREDNILTEVFPGRDEPVLHRLSPLQEYARSTTLTREKAESFAAAIGAPVDGRTKSEVLTGIQAYIDEAAIESEFIADTLATTVYLPEIEPHIDEIPAKLLEAIGLTA